MLGPSTGLSQPLIARYSDALPGAKRRSRGAGSCMGRERTIIAECPSGLRLTGKVCASGPTTPTLNPGCINPVGDESAPGGSPPWQ